jgi:hypothetical protein
MFIRRQKGGALIIIKIVRQKPSTIQHGQAGPWQRDSGASGLARA